jgi:hypothetical protein
LHEQIEDLKQTAEIDSNENNDLFGIIFAEEKQEASNEHNCHQE